MEFLCLVFVPSSREAHNDKESIITQEEGEFVMEMHLVHQTSDGKIAVIGVLFKLGEPDKFLDKFWSYITNLEEETPVGPIDMDELDFGDMFIRYRGSLTTEPYTEGVRWTVMFANWNTISEEQLNIYKTKFPTPNNRETQPLNGRKVILYSPSSVSFEPEIAQKGATLVQSS